MTMPSLPPTVDRGWRHHEGMRHAVCGMRDVERHYACRMPHAVCLSALYTALVQHCDLGLDHDVVLEPEQIRQLAHEVVLVVGEPAVGIDDAPHGFHDLDPVLQ